MANSELGQPGMLAAGWKEVDADIDSMYPGPDLDQGLDEDFKLDNLFAAEQARVDTGDLDEEIVAAIEKDLEDALFEVYDEQIELEQQEMKGHLAANPELPVPFEQSPFYKLKLEREAMLNALK